MIKKIIKRGYYILIKLKIALKLFIIKPSPSKYLFILCPPYCGSTLLHEVLSKSSNVSSNNILGAREGQTLPEVAPIMYNDREKRWDETITFPWDIIKYHWSFYWDSSKEILLEKSPPNLIRALQIQEEFNPSFFICMVRNPYVHCEALIRKNMLSPSEAANFTLKCLRHQQQNVQSLQKVFLLSYEEMTDSRDEVKKRLKKFLPLLQDISFHGNFNTKNSINKESQIQNLNNFQIKKLRKKQFTEINSVFKKEKQLLSFFNYDLIKID